MLVFISRVVYTFFNHLIASYTGFFWWVFLGFTFHSIYLFGDVTITDESFKFWPKLGTYGYWAERVFFQHATLTVTRANYLWWSSPSTGDTHTCCRAFCSGVVTTCFNDLGLSQQGSGPEHPHSGRTLYD